MRVGFTFAPIQNSQAGLIWYSPAWTADPGVNYQLSSAGATLEEVNGAYYQLGTGLPYNPASGNFGGFVGVPAPHRTAQSIGGRVGAAHRVVHILVRHHREGRAELLFVDQPHAVRDFTDDRGLVEVALAAQALAAREDLCAVFLRVLYQLGNALELRLVV